MDDFCTATRHFTSNSTPPDDFFLTNLRNESSSCWLLHDDTQWVVLLLTIFARGLVILRLIRQLCAPTRPRHVLMLTIFARPLIIYVWFDVTRRLIQDNLAHRHVLDTSSCWQFLLDDSPLTTNSTSQDASFETTCPSTRPLVDDYCMTTRHFTSNSTSQYVSFETTCGSTRPLVGHFCATTPDFSSNSTSQDYFFKTNLRIGTSSTRPLVDDFCTPTRHFTSNLTPQDDIFLINLCNESSSCWLFHDDTQWVVLL